MKTNIKKLIDFFTIPNSRCSGNYQRGNRYCILGAMDKLLSVKDMAETKAFLLENLEVYIFDFNKKNPQKALDFSKKNVNLATFNDQVDDATMLDFLTINYNLL